MEWCGVILWSSVGHYYGVVQSIITEQCGVWSKMGIIEQGGVLWSRVEYYYGAGWSIIMEQGGVLLWSKVEYYYEVMRSIVIV